MIKTERTKIQCKGCKTFFAPNQHNQEYCSSSCRRFRTHWQTKIRLVHKYGDGKCSVCGFDDIRALNLHHPNGDGLKHRKELGGQFYKKLDSEESDVEMIVLCANCHAITHCNKLSDTKRSDVLQ